MRLNHCACGSLTCFSSPSFSYNISSDCIAAGCSAEKIRLCASVSVCERVRDSGHVRAGPVGILNCTLAGKTHML